MYPKGTLVRVRITPSGLTAHYPAAAWLKGEQTVRLLEDAPGEGTLDVIDVDPYPLRDVKPFDYTDGDFSIYDFNILGEVKQ